MSYGLDVRAGPTLRPTQRPIQFVSGKSDRAVKLTTFLHRVPSSKKVELYLLSPINLHGVVLILLSTGTIKEPG
jgi:hypothetical protein